MKDTVFRLGATLVVFASFLCTSNAQAQGPTFDSYKMARLILDRTLEAYGGLDAIRSVSNFTVKTEVEQFHRNQSRRPGVSERTLGSSEIVVDFRNNRYRYDVARGVIGGNPAESYEIITGRDGVFVDMSRRTKRSRPPSPSWQEGFTARILPQIMLMNVYKRSATLRHLGAATINDRPHNVISFTSADGVTASLYIDGTTNLLSKYESLTNDPLSGDAVVEVYFVSYQRVGKFKVPVEMVHKIAGETIFKTTYKSVAFDTPLADSQFKLTFDPKEQMPAPEAPAVQKHAQKVYTVTASGSNVLFVEFKDHIFVMEAPGGDAVSREAISRIKNAIPGKPIKYLALTHFHDDHSSGMRPYLADGATLVTTKGNRDFFAQMLKSRPTLTADVTVFDAGKTTMEFVEGKRVFTDGTTTLELYDIGPGPHADEMLVAYFPNEKILYQGDILDRPPNGDMPIANPTTGHFAEWLKAKRLTIEMIIPVHGTVTTVAEMETALTVRPSAK